jgi:hypothetical protein
VEEGLEYLEQIGWLKTMAADWGFPPIDETDDTQGKDIVGRGHTDTDVI